MLLLSRNLGETIVIGDNIRVTKSKGNQVQLGIEAPQDIRIVREELLERERAPDLAKPAQGAV